MRLLVQHLRVITGNRRPYRRDDPPPDQSVAKHRLREGQVHPSVHQNGLTDSLTRSELGQPIGAHIGQVLGVTGGVVLLAIKF
jgi:hypothetical protein